MDRPGAEVHLFIFFQCCLSQHIEPSMCQSVPEMWEMYPIPTWVDSTSTGGG